jgi:hypothetical protein
MSCMGESVEFGSVSAKNLIRDDSNSAPCPPRKIAANHQKFVNTPPAIR